MQQMSADTDKPALRMFEITSDIRVKTYDIDFAGHVSNITYLRWFEDMRLQIFDQFFPLENFINDGFLPIITETRVVYKKSVGLFDKPVGHMWIASKGKASFQFEGEIKVDNQITTQSWFTGLFVSQKTMKPVRMPALILEKEKELYSNI